MVKNYKQLYFKALKMGQNLHANMEGFPEPVIAILFRSVALVVAMCMDGSHIPIIYGTFPLLKYFHRCYCN